MTLPFTLDYFHLPLRRQEQRCFNTLVLCEVRKVVSSTSRTNRIPQNLTQLPREYISLT